MQALVADRDLEMVSENVRARALGSQQELRYRFMARRKDGSYFHVEVHGKSSTFNNRPAAIGVLIDVTEQVEAEQRLRERDNKIQALFSGNVIGILCWNSQGFIEDANPVFREMLGLTSSDFAGDGLSWKSITPIEYYDICTEHVFNILNYGHSTPIQKEYVSRTGERIPVLVNGVRLGSTQGSGISFVLDLRNVRHIESERDMLASMVERAPAVMFVQNLKGEFVYLNEAAHAKGMPFGGLMGKTEFDYMDTTTAQRVASDRQRIVQTGALEQFEEPVSYQGINETFWFRTTKWPLRDGKGSTVGVVGVAVDVTAHKIAEAELTRSQNLISAVFENMPLISVLKDVQGRIIYFNGRFTKVHGITLEQARGKQIWEVLPQLSEEEVRRSDTYVLSTGLPYIQEREMFIDGRSIPYLVNVFPVRDMRGDTVALCALVQSLTDVKKAQAERAAREKAEFEATHDSLTGLPNRRLLMMKAEQVLLQSRQDGGQFVVCFIDVDRFKEINDTLGHAAGDELLQVLARRMSSCIRESDILARLGGDEFVAVLRGDVESPEIMKVMERLAYVVSERVTLKQGDVVVSCSMGHAGYPKDGVSMEVLLMQSDTLMYKNKTLDRCVSFRRPEEGKR
jgi:diguanylate cyclase (GGDEF)-like protein/PAS domain S-box-containing protein